jgi:RNA polymerase sigma factor (sigma-70 family)
VTMGAAMRSGHADAGELAAVVARAKEGDREALEQLVRALQDDLFRLALRMTAHPQDAEDATQEILIKVVTRLDTFRGEASVRTWAYRIAVRHVLDRRKSRVEALALDFDRFGADLLDGLADAPDPDPVLAEEVKRGCTLAMLTCLDRQHRVAYVLADVFDLPHAEAADLCAVTGDVFRQRVSRARRMLEAFTRAYCGLVDPSAPCLCGRRVARAEALGRLSRTQPGMVALGAGALEAATRDMEALHDTARVLRQHPAYRAPAGLGGALLAALADRRRHV